MNKPLTLENKCELNAIRYEIIDMRYLNDSDKLYAVHSMLCDMLDLYDADSIMGSVRYRLEICRKLNKVRSL